MRCVAGPIHPGTLETIDEYLQIAQVEAVPLFVVCVRVRNCPTTWATRLGAPSLIESGNHCNGGQRQDCPD